MCGAPASHWKPCTITLSEIGDVENGNRKKNPGKQNMLPNLLQILHAWLLQQYGRHIWQPHLWLFHCKLGLLGSLFYTTVITLSFYVKPLLLRCFFVCRNIKTMEVMWSKASDNPWNTDLLLIPQRNMWVSFFGWLFHITTTTTESVINGDNKIKSMRGVCNLFNAQYSWVSARK